MIISASRRCDIPAYHMDEFMKDLRYGYCLVPQPFNIKELRRVSLLPADVDCKSFLDKRSAAASFLAA